MLDESLRQFGLAAAEALDELMVLVPPDAVADDPALAQRALSRYVRLVEQIGQAAADSGLAGVQSVCALVETNLLMLNDEVRPLTPEEVAVLEEWPRLLFGYLANQADSGSSIALLMNLSGAWPLPLPEAEADEELRRLTGGSGPVANPVAIGDEAIPDIEGAVAAAFAYNGEQPVAEPHLSLPPLEVQQVDREVLGVLSAEIGQMREQFADELGAAASANASGSPDAAHAALANYIDLLDRLAITVQSVGLTALCAVFTRISQQLALQAQDALAAQLGLLGALPEYVCAYLDHPTDASSCAALMELLTDPAWTPPVDGDNAVLWMQALASVQFMAVADQENMRPVHASLDDVSLELPGDVNPELLDGLLHELPVQTAAFTSAIAHITSGQGNAKDMERAMRAAHTLKGAANTVGVRGIANLTHHLEDILVALIESEKMPGAALADALVNAGDCLEAMSETLLGVGAPPPQAQQVLQLVLDCANRIDREGVAAEPALDEHAAEPSVEQYPATEPAKQSLATEHSLRVPAPVVDELLRLAGETLISNSQIQERLRITAKQSAVIRQQNRLIQQLVGELEELVDIRGVTSGPQQVRAAGEFDALEFEHYNELHTITHRLVEASTDAREMGDEAERQLAALDGLLEEQRKLQMANQYTVLRTRVVPVASVVSRLRRGVRQTARLLDKQVELEIRGEHTSIDSQVLSDLMDPLMHVLRNAVDHGIEMPEERAAIGKRPEGTIALSFAREGNVIVVRCRDDGAGLDYAAIRRIAERKGMIAPGQEHSEEELARLILSPGFSTRDEASQVSGRGVGMDVVSHWVQEMKGTLALNSRRGEGLAVELRLPATLLSTHVLIVRQREKRLAISTRGVEDVRFITREQIQQIGPRQFYREGGQVHGLVKLESLLSLPGDRRAQDRNGFPVMLTRLDDGTLSPVLVQEILDSREVVMKNFGRYVPRTQGVIGAVILGDGGVAPVIDLVELLRQPVLRRLPESAADGATAIELPPERRARTALVVDDSLSARRAVVQVMKDAGFDVRAAGDGLEAVNMLARFVPDIILADMEMPRMNGLELAAHVRSSERTKAVPVIMITSRTTDKHREMSKASGVNVHLTKPFSDDALLQHVMRLTTA
jgi:chemotaxis protein histidine kinase CheA